MSYKTTYNPTDRARFDRRATSATLACGYGLEPKTPCRPDNLLPSRKSLANNATCVAAGLSTVRLDFNFVLDFQVVFTRIGNSRNRYDTRYIIHIFCPHIHGQKQMCKLKN